MAATKTVEAQVVLSLGDRLTAGLNRIQARINRLTTGLGINRLSSSLGNLGSKLGALGPAIGQSLGRLSALTGLMGVGVGGAAYAAFGLTKGVADVGAELTESSFKLGIGVEALQEYRYAANMAGVENDTLNTAFQKLGINMSAAAHGNKGMAETFKSLGVAVKDSSGNLRSTEDVLNDTMAALARIEDPARRNELAFKAFGRSGVDLVKVLADGEQGFINAREEARKLGFVMSDSAAAMGDEFGDNVDRLTKRLQGLGYFLGVQLLPVFNELVEGITGWVAANQELIRSTISEWVEKLAGFMRDLMDPTSELRTGFADLVDRVTGFYDAIRPLIDWIGGPGVAGLTLLGVYIAGPLIAAFAALLPAIWLVGVALMTTPIGWIILGLGLMGGAIYVLIQKWDEFVAYWAGMWDRITAGFQKGFVVGILNALNEFNPVTHIARGLDAVLVYFTGFSLIGAGTKLIDDFAAAMDAAFANVLTWAGNVGGAIVTAILDGIAAGWSQISGFFDVKIAELTSALPDWIRGPLGIEVTPTAAPGAPAVSNPHLAAPSASANPYFADLPIPAPNVQPTPAPLAPSAVPMQTQEVETDAVNAAVLNVPDPIIVSQPQNVSAPFTSNITVNVQGMTEAQGQAMVQRAIAAESARHAANVTGALND